MEWICKVCGYEMEGERPIDICPVCGVDESNFKAVKEVASGNEDLIKTAIRQFSYGMFVLTSEADGIINGQAANSVMQLTSSPRRISVCMNKINYTTGLVLKRRELVVNIVGQDEYNLIANFGFSSGRDRNKFERFKYELKDGLPYLPEYSLAGLFCQVEKELDVGTHIIFVCTLKDGFVNEDKKGVLPMTYSDFRVLKSGGTLKVSDDKADKKEESKMGEKGKKYICKICGYVHDPEVEGIAFEDLPDDYACPLCGAPKSDFEPMA